MTSLQTRLFGLLSTTWGAILVYFYHSSRVYDYLAPGFHTLVLIGGIGMMILGLYSLINPQYEEAEESCCSHDHHDHDHCHDEQCDHDHSHDHHDHDHDCGSCDHHHDDGHGPLTTILLTLIPLMIAMTYTTDSLSNNGLAKKGLYEPPVIAQENSSAIITREQLEKEVPKNEHGEFEIRLITTHYAAGDEELRETFQDLPIVLEGRITVEKLNNAKGNRLRIFQSIITCCAADLQVVGVSIEFPENAPRPQVDDWVKAGGILTFETIDGITYPLLKIRAIMPAEEPYSQFRLRQ